MKKMIVQQKKRILSLVKWQRSVNAILAAMLFWGMASGWLHSCIKEETIDSRTKNGAQVVVNFVLNQPTYGNDEAVESRSFSADEPATDFVRVHGAQDVFLYATLEEETAPTGLRYATSNTMADNHFVHIVAFRASDSSIENQAIFKVTGGELIPVTDFLTVTVGNSYIFAAYSFGTLSLSNIGSGNAATFAGLTTNPATDLLWGITPSSTLITGPENAVDIKLNHLFSRVRVEASSASIIPAHYFTAIGGAHINPNYGGSLSLNVLTGALTPSGGPSSTGASLVGTDKWSYNGGTSWTSETAINATAPYNSTVESKYVYVFANGANTLALKITNLSLGDGSSPSFQLGAYELRFTKTLEPGKSYTMKLKFRLLEWAGSNIYWDINRNSLFFLPTPTYSNPPNPALDVSQGIQGVYFAWGSLVGVSPRGIAIDLSTALYVPPVVNANWTTPDYTAFGASQTAIPRLPVGASLVSATWLDDHSGRNYLSETAVHSPSTYQGDICKYLSDNGFSPSGEWRMPNSKEFQDRPANPAYQLSSPFGAHPGFAGVSADGTTNFYSIPSYLRRPLVLTNTIFPAGGSRNNAGTLVTGATVYLTGSPLGVNNSNVLDASYAMRFTATPPPVHNFPLEFGNYGLVRCVRSEMISIPSALIIPTVDIVDPAPYGWEPGGTLGTGSSGSQGEVWY